MTARAACNQSTGHSEATDDSTRMGYNISSDEPGGAGTGIVEITTIHQHGL